MRITPEFSATTSVRRATSLDTTVPWTTDDCEETRELVRAPAAEATDALATTLSEMTAASDDFVSSERIERRMVTPHKVNS